MEYTYNNHNIFVPEQIHINIPNIKYFKDISENCNIIYDYFYSFLQIKN